MNSCTVLLRQSAGYWVALCLENRLVGQEKTQHDAIANLKEAIESFQEVYESEEDIYNAPVEKFAASKQIIAIEIDYLGLTNAAWKMLDCLEAYLAKKLSGIVYAPYDGFYDEELQLIYNLEPPISIG